jgi:hypothetical protein
VGLDVHSSFGFRSGRTSFSGIFRIPAGHVGIHSFQGKINLFWTLKESEIRRKFWRDGATCNLHSVSGLKKPGFRQLMSEYNHSRARLICYVGIQSFQGKINLFQILPES